MRIQPDKDVTLIIDEIDMMNGCNSFSIDSFMRKNTCIYFQKLLNGYRNWIGFSATFSSCGRELSNSNFPESMYIEIQSVNSLLGENSLVSVKYFKDQNEKFKAIESTVKE